MGGVRVSFLSEQTISVLVLFLAAIDAETFNPLRLLLHPPVSTPICPLLLCLVRCLALSCSLTFRVSVIVPGLATINASSVHRRLA